jgi:hypothetical protein
MPIPDSIVDQIDISVLAYKKSVVSISWYSLDTTKIYSASAKYLII